MTSPTRVRSLAIWLVTLVATTAALLAFRGELDKAHVALVLLLVVLGAGAQGGRLLGLSIAALSFIVFDVLFLPPFGTLVVRNPLDWLVLVAFLVTSVVAAQLLHREQEATRRAGEERSRSEAERAQAESLRETDKLKDSLIASVSHDLRTPLTTIKALAHDLGELGDERSQIIEEQADRLNRYVADLLDLSRVSAGAMPITIELNAVDDLLSAVVEETQGTLGTHTLDVTLPRDGALLAGMFDLGHAIRIVANLVENASKYAPGEAPISLEARQTGQWLEISVSDRGPGVPADEAERIFTPFYRPLGSPADTGSAGLGLALCRRMAELQGGTLTYAPRDGGGSTFTLRLPASDLTAAAREAQRFDG